jgi:hypothetical protein
MTSQGGDELRARAYLHRLDAHPFGHQAPPPPAPLPVTSPEDPDMLLALVLAGLAPGIATAWLLRRRGWPLALLAGLGVTVSLPGLLLLAMVAFPPLGIAVAFGSLIAAIRAYDDGRVWIATAWTAATAVALACAGVAW